MSFAALSSSAVECSGHGAACAKADVVIATLAHGRAQTGVHTHGRALLDGLREAAFPCRIETPFSGSLKWLAVFAVRPLLIYPFDKTRSTRWYRRWHLEALRERLIQSIGRDGASAVIAQCPVGAQAALDARQRISGTFPVAMVCHFNHSEAQEYRDKGELDDEHYFQEVLAFEKSVLEAVDHVVYVSAWARRIVEQERAISPRASSVIWNGIDAAQPPQHLRRADLGLATDDLALINVGTLEKRKNQLGLLDLFAQVSTAVPSARLLLVGDGPARQEIERRIVQLGLSGKVRLLGFRKDVADLLRVADLYVHYAAMENCPMALIEAARAGLAVAAAATGGVPELLAELGGIPLDAADPARSLAALRPLLTQPHRRAEAGKQARESFRRRFTREAMVGQYQRVLGLGAKEGAP